jgi:hypothetical protein
VKQRFIFILFILWMGQALAQQEQKVEKSEIDEKNTKFLMIQPFTNKHLDEFETSFVNKMMLQVTTKQIEYQVALTRKRDLRATKGTIVNLELYIRKDEKTGLYRVKTLLADIKNKKIINKVERVNINRDKLIRNVQIALELLFYPVEKANEEKAKKAPPKTSVKGSKELQQIDKGLTDFRKRVLALKKELALKFAAIKAKNARKKKKKDKESEDSDSKKKESESTEQTSSAAQLAAQKRRQQQNKKGKPVKESFSELGLGYVSTSIDSKDIVETNSAISYVGVNYRMTQYLDLKKKNFIRMYAMVGTMVSDTQDVDVGNYMNIYGGYARFLYGPIYMGLMLSYETFNFANLPNIAKKLQPANINMLMANIVLGGRFFVFKNYTEIEVIIGNLMGASSEYETLQASTGITGSSTTVRVTWAKVYKSLGSMFEYTTSSLSATGGTRDVTASNTAMSIHAIYSF